MLCRSHDPTLRLRSLFFGGEEGKPSSLLFGFLCLFCFFGHFKFDFEFESDFKSDFGSDKLISLSYSLPVFSANSFGLLSHILVHCAQFQIAVSNSVISTLIEDLLYNIYL